MDRNVLLRCESLGGEKLSAVMFEEKEERCRNNERAWTDIFLKEISVNNINCLLLRLGDFPQRG